MDINSEYDMVSVSNVYIDNADEDSESSSFTELLTDTLNPPIQNRNTHFKTDLSKTLAHFVKGNNDNDTPKCYETTSDTIVIIDSDTDEEPSLQVPQRPRPTDEYSGPWLNALKRKMYSQQKDSSKKVSKVTKKKSNLTIDDCLISDDNSDSNDDQDCEVNISPEADLGYCEGDDADDNMSIDNGIHKTPTTTSSTPEFKATPVSKSVGRKLKRSQRFYCTDCRAVFSELHEHDRTVEEEQMNKEFTCDFCHEEFFSQYDYTKHGQSCARRCTCQFCGHVFHEITQLKQHLFTEHAISKENTSSINIPTNASSKSSEKLSTSSFSEYSTFSSDLNTSLSEPVEQEDLVDSTKFSCNLCSSIFSNALNLKRHTTTKHPRQTRTVGRKKGKSTNSTVTISHQQKTFTCDFCQKQFMSEDEYSVHCKNCTVRCTCPFCGTTFQEMNELRRHMFTQHDLSDDESESTEVLVGTASISSKFLCSNCGKRFSTASNLQRHIRSQHHRSTKKRGTACKVKTKKYIPQSSGKHTGKQPVKTKSKVKCRSASSSQMKREEALSSKKKHKCKECGIRLSTIYSLRRHRTIHARKKAKAKKDKAKLPLPEKLDDIKKTGRFCCGVCGDRFNHLFNLERHAMRHSESTPYQCQVCFTRFSQLQHLQCHFEKFHIMDS